MLNKMIFLDKELESFFSKSDDPFKRITEINGTIYRNTANRVTKRFSIGERTFFLKYHGPIGYKEVLKNVLKFQLPTVSAKPEWRALEKVNSLGLDVPKPLAMCSRGLNPAKSESFIITESVEPNKSIEDVLDSDYFSGSHINEKRRFIRKVAKISKTLHEGGVNHRDLYLCHFLIEENLDSEKPIYLIDLHRAQIRKEVPNRWAIKDIGGLIHSAIGYGMTERDLYRFFEVYFNKPLRKFSKEENNFLKLSITRAFKMYMKPILNDIDISSERINSENSRYYKKTEENLRYIVKKDFAENFKNLISDIDLIMNKGEIIKKEAGHFIIACDFNGERIFIKKYQMKNFFHKFRKLASKTRARVAWESSHWLNSAGISTFEIIGIIERFNSISTTDSYLISRNIEGKRLEDMKFSLEESISLANKFNAFFKKLNWISFNHGDAKKQNFYVHNNSLIAFDLDSSKRRVFYKNRYLLKDKRRIIKSFKDNEVILNLLKKRMDSK